MIDTFETYAVEPTEVSALTQPINNEHNASTHRFFERFRLQASMLWGDGRRPKGPRTTAHHSRPYGTCTRKDGELRLLGQVLRFGLVGGLNTLVDVLILNSLLLLFPTTNAPKLLAYNALAYSLGAVNSFFLNKYWTFGCRQGVTLGEQARFILTTLCGIGWSGVILWLASKLIHPFLVNATLWANASKALAIAGTALISYLGMRLWVFVSKGQTARAQRDRVSPTLPLRSAQGKLRDASLCPSRQILRYAQDDTYTIPDNKAIGMTRQTDPSLSLPSSEACPERSEWAKGSG